VGGRRANVDVTETIAPANRAAATSITTMIALPRAFGAEAMGV
jgi:hypothetical protein